MHHSILQRFLRPLAFAGLASDRFHPPASMRAMSQMEFEPQLPNRDPWRGCAGQRARSNRTGPCPPQKTPRAWLERLR